MLGSWLQFGIQKYFSLNHWRKRTCRCVEEIYLSALKWGLITCLNNQLIETEAFSEKNLLLAYIAYLLYGYQSHFDRLFINKVASFFKRFGFRKKCCLEKKQTKLSSFSTNFDFTCLMPVVNFDMLGRWYATDAAHKVLRQPKLGRGAQ